MDEDIKQNDYVFTKKAHCIDCYRCLKSCPVKAIKVKHGQAYIMKDRCIDCNICKMNCAQNAISYISNKEKFYEYLQSKKRLVASVAPSYSSICADWERARFPSALRQLGFNFASGSSVGASVVANQMAKIVKDNPNKSYITSACPTVVNYIEKYRPDLIENIIPVVSPYIAHAKWLRHKLGNDIVIVHIDSCLPKKIEIMRDEFKGIVDLVLSFAELRELFDENNISLKMCEESSYDEIPFGNGRLYQFVGGLANMMDGYINTLETNILVISGFQDIKHSLDFVKNNKGILVDSLFCYKGCINGPGIHTDTNIFEKRKEIIDYIKSRKHKTIDKDPLEGVIDVNRTFNYNNKVAKPTITEKQINTILTKTKNNSTDNRPNCFSCGYPTCVEHATAVLEGMAEVEMCTPYMRRMAESKAAKIIESSPNGVVTLSSDLKIISMNKKFRELFWTTDTHIGKPISTIMDPEPFYEINNTNLTTLEKTVVHDKYNIICYELIYRIAEDDSFAAIFMDITKNINEENSLDELRMNIILQANELLKHQMNMAANIAKSLGENTAQSEVLLENLIKFTQSEKFSI
ncbi:MAG: hypothetical protein FWG85_01275 [Bacteroidetes bacterium]|nr:hypothetical protein [Bacteroidota bacterium]